MADVFKFPKLELDREKVTFYRTPFPKLTDKKVVQMAKVHGMKAKPQDGGSLVLLRDRRATLELFRASDSLRWSMLANIKSEPHANGGPPKLPDEAVARKKAVAFLRQRKVPTKGAAVDSITHGMLARATRKEREVKEQPVALHVNYRYELDGLPVLGPGAKIQVTFVDDKTPAEMYRFWRAPKADGEMELLPTRAVFDLLRRDPDFAELGDDARVEYRNPRLG